MLCLCGSVAGLQIERADPGIPNFAVIPLSPYREDWNRMLTVRTEKEEFILET